jgi:hypothetical protein
MWVNLLIVVCNLEEYLKIYIVLPGEEIFFKEYRERKEIMFGL